MLFRSDLSKRILLALGLVAFLLAQGSAVQAQTPAPQSAEDQELEKLLTGAELFFQKGFNEQAQRWEYKVAWSQNGETSIIVMYVREIAKRGDGSRVCVAYGWTQIIGMPQGQDLPPAVIKGVAAVNDNLNTGNVSAAGGGVFANTGIVMKDLSSDALWIYLWDMHDTRVALKKELEKMLAGG